MKHRRIAHIATLSLTIAAVTAPAAVATQNLVSPDAQDAVQTSSSAGTTDQLDRRSPDAADAADGRGTWNAPRVTVVRVAQPAAPSSGGLDWGDAGIGAGAVGGLMLIGLGGGLVVMHRRRGGQRPATTA